MTYTEIWNFIVNEYNQNQFSKEEILQRKWEGYFSDFFGYKHSFGDIDSHRVLPIGSSNRTIPDIILRRNKTDLFDVELKQYNLPFSKDMKNQLISYLNQLHISVGILICKEIHVYIYYYNESKTKELVIPFEKDNTDGIALIELLQKEQFSREKLEEVIYSKTRFKEDVEKTVNEINSDKISELLINYFSKQNSLDVINAALDKILITVSKKDVPPPPPPPPPPPVFGKYRFRGNVYNKTQLVLAVIKAFVEDNPNTTFEKLKEFFPDKLQGSWGVIQRPETVCRRTSEPKKRFHMDNPICLKDGSVIVVCSQWGAGLNFENFLAKCDLLGYTIISV